MNTENVTTWRDIADQLTDKQRAELEHWEAHPELPPREDGADPTMFPGFADKRRKSMLNMAREYAARNVAAIRYSDVPEPADVTNVTEWLQWDDDTFARYVSGTCRHVRHLSVAVHGVQFTDGAVERTVRIFPGEHDDGEMDAGLAREVAAALCEAADEMDAATEPTTRRGEKAARIGGHTQTSPQTEPPPCGYRWCRNDKTGHVEHYGNGSTTASYNGPGSAVIECSAYVTADRSGPYADEIFLHIKTTRPGGHAPTIDQGVGVFLADSEARELRRLLDVALANRAEVRGTDCQ